MGEKATQDLGDDQGIFTEQYAASLDAEDPLRHLRNEFIIPTKADLKRKRIAEGATQSTCDSDASSPCTYLCGNSLGLQPRRTSTYVSSYLRTWASKGVYGHFQPLEDAVAPPWVHIDEACKEEMGKIVGAGPEEVAVMQSLTANLHLLMASFYRPTRERYKIIIEGKAFPSDHYAVESQIRHHNLSPSTAMILISPPSPTSPLLPTQHILDTITQHASSTALLLLPGIQFYTGQLLDIAAITAHAQRLGVTVGWDLAHAVGNVELRLHDWGVDFAAWCNYKYMNSGPGAIGGLFVHERHGRVSTSSTSASASASACASADGETKGEQQTVKAVDGELSYVPRLSGWWGSDKSSRFAMENRFVPIAGAAGWQLSNPSAIDTTAVLASLSVFGMTSMRELRNKSLRLTGYLERLLLAGEGEEGRGYEIITPKDPEERGAQLSVRLESGLLEVVMGVLEEEGVVVDERRPDVVRVAPAPLYNTFADVLRFAKVFRSAVGKAKEEKARGTAGVHGGVERHSVMVEGGKEDRGWGEVK